MGRRGRRARRRANKAALHAAAVAAGVPSHAAAATINNPTAKWSQVYSQVQNQIADREVVNERNAAERERQVLQAQMQERQAELIQAVRESQPKIPEVKELPRANRILKPGGYTPAVSTRKKKKKAGDAQDNQTGAYQFASPLSMGIGLGSSGTTGIGLG